MPRMGLSVDREQTATVLKAAARLADSDRSVPEEWTQRTREIDECPSRSFTPALGTALLARATNPEIDALALKPEAGPHAYSARSVATNVLVPGTVKYGYDLRATGREPLNNQPFFRYDRIDRIDHVRNDAVPWVTALTDACNAINKLGADDAKLALAAYLRVRWKPSRRAVPLIPETPRSLRSNCLCRRSLSVPTQQENEGRLSLWQHSTLAGARRLLGSRLGDHLHRGSDPHHPKMTTSRTSAASLLIDAVG
jgi:hypothetical protein